MDEKNIDFSRYSVCVRIGYDIQYINMDVFAVLCDKFLLEELCDCVAQSPAGTIIYTGFRNKTKFVITINPKEM